MRIALIMVGLTAGCALDASPPAEDVGQRDEAVRMESGKWDCRTHWSAYTTVREMHGRTDFECGRCGDISHTRDLSFVDIVGGISQSCQDHSSSFFGPYQGEWSGCQGAENGLQRSTGARAIEGVNGSWDRWPSAYRSSMRYVNSPYDLWVPASASMNDAFATVYDLDFCFAKQLIGTIYWPDFNVEATLVDGGPGDDYAKYELHGAVGKACASNNVDACTMPSNDSDVCADLHVDGTMECFYEADCPMGDCELFN